MLTSTLNPYCGRLRLTTLNLFARASRVCVNRACIRWSICHQLNRIENLFGRKIKKQLGDGSNLRAVSTIVTRRGACINLTRFLFVFISKPFGSDDVSSVNRHHRDGSVWGFSSLCSSSSSSSSLRRRGWKMMLMLTLLLLMLDVTGRKAKYHVVAIRANEKWRFSSSTFTCLLSWNVRQTLRDMKILILIEKLKSHNLNFSQLCRCDVPFVCGEASKHIKPAESITSPSSFALASSSPSQVSKRISLVFKPQHKELSSHTISRLASHWKQWANYTLSHVHGSTQPVYSDFLSFSAQTKVKK